MVQYIAARSGVGIALVPLREASLVRVAKDWGTPELDISLVFVTRRGLLPAVRVLIDYLAERMPTVMA